MINPGKNERKQIIVGTVKIISFALVFVLILQTMSLTYFSKKNASRDKTKLSKAYEFLQEPENTIDIVGIGNSDLYSAFVPAELWTKQGYTATVISSPHQTVWQSYKMMQTLFEKQRPKLVIIETDMLYGTDVEESADISSFDSLFKYVFDNYDTEDFEDLIKSQFTMFLFHNKWKQIGHPKRPDMLYSHGYKYSSKVCRVKAVNYMLPSDEAEPVKSSDMEHLNQLLELCRDNGSKVLFVEIPTLTSWNMQRHNAVAKLSEQMGIAFIDLNLAVDDIGLDLPVSFRDRGNHLNYKAACKVTDYLGTYIAENFKLTDNRDNPDYAFYADSISTFYDEIKDKDEHMYQ